MIMMKFVATTIFLILLFVATNAKKDDHIDGTDFKFCSKNNEILRDAKDILRYCNRDKAAENPEGIDKKNNNYLGTDYGSLLLQCLDPRRGDGKGKEKSGEPTTDTFEVDGIETLCQCCNGGDRDRDCEDTLEDALKFIDICLDECISGTFLDYLFCIRENCYTKNAEKCWDTMFGRKGSHDGNFVGKDMVIDMKKMEIHLEGELLGEEINSCSRLVKFVDDTCDYGTKCCKKCSEPFTNFMSCLVDDMLVPFSRRTYDKSFTMNGNSEEVCTVVEDKNGCHLYQEDERKLRLGDKLGNRQGLGPFQPHGKLVDLPPVDLSQDEIAVLNDRSSNCKNQLRWGIILYGYEEAAKKYVECLDHSVLEIVKDEASVEPETAGSTSKNTGLFAFLTVMAGTAFTF